MTNPVTELNNWLKTQSTEIQSEIAFFISAYHSSFDLPEISQETEQALESFYSQIEKYSGIEFENVAFIISFRAIFDYIFVRNRGASEGWDKPKELFKSIVKATDSTMSDSLKKFSMRKLHDIPARMEEWIEVCSQWEELKASVLSDEAINAWEDKNMLERYNDGCDID